MKWFLILIYFISFSAYPCSSAFKDKQQKAEEPRQQKVEEPRQQKVEEVKQQKAEEPRQQKAEELKKQTAYFLKEAETLISDPKAVLEREVMGGIIFSIDSPILNKIKQEFENSENPYLREIVVYSLINPSNPIYSILYPGRFYMTKNLLKIAKDPKMQVRKTSMETMRIISTWWSPLVNRGLFYYNNNKLYTELISVMKKERSINVKREYAKMLRALLIPHSEKEAKFIKKLEDFFSNPNSNIKNRKYLAETLGILSLVKYRWFTKQKKENKFDMLIHTFAKSKDFHFREIAAWAVAESGNIKLLKTLAQDSNSNVRKAVVESVGKITEIQDILFSTKLNISFKEEMLNILKPLTEDTDPNVRKVARQSVETIEKKQRVRKQILDLLGTYSEKVFFL